MAKKQEHAEMDALLKVMLEMPPKPHEPLKKKAKPASRASAKKREPSA